MADQSVLFHTLQSQIQQKDSELLNLKMENSHLQARLLNLVGQDPTAVELEKENYELKKGYEQLQAKNEDLNQQKHQIEMKCNKMIENVIKVDNALKEAVKALEAQEQAAAEKQEQLDQLQAKFKAAQDKSQQQISALEQQLELCRIEKEKLEHELSSSTKQLEQIAGYKLRIQALSDRIEAFETAEAEQTNLYESLQRQYQQAIEEQSKLKGIVSGFESQMEKHQQQNESKEQEKYKLYDTLQQVTQAQIQIQGLEQEKARLEKENTYIFQQTQTRLETSEKDRIAKQHELQLKQTELQALQTELRHQKQVAESLEAQLHVFLTELSDDHEVHATEDTLDQIQALVHAKLALLDQYQAENMELLKKQQKQTAYQTQMQELTEANAKLQADYAKLQQIVKRMTARKANSTLKPKQLDKENARPTGLKRRLEAPVTNSLTKTSKPSTTKPRTIQVKSRYMQSS